MREKNLLETFFFLKKYLAVHQEIDLFGSYGDQMFQMFPDKKLQIF
jgi:hypothetical protein